AVDAAVHMAYTMQQCLDGYSAAMQHTINRKAESDRRVARTTGERIFTKGQLVQVYRSDLDYTFSTERKLLPKWSTPYRIANR
ncbi:hypothetical protein DENSPDRAFT_759666, partial [Dentipellis sp. KUC8613]